MPLGLSVNPVACLWPAIWEVTGNAVAVAPSYQAFLNLAEGLSVDWNDRAHGSAPSPQELLRGAEKLLQGRYVSVVAVDMPLSKRCITGRRNADNALSQEFGKYGCAAHSPSENRPGWIGEGLTRGFVAEGYKLATKGGEPNPPNALMEVYPHPALVRLMHLDYRLPYKVSKTSRYWPGRPIGQRVGNIISELNKLMTALSAPIECINLSIPAIAVSLSSLKPFEDALDSLVCAWVAIQFLENKAIPYGDEDAAIWVPK